ncbi:MAG: thioredoxin domain-containing protein [Deltaproteobacteria bacterium]|nr:thioredoxin domain-containing protein [Deltaproteobacteria bacterium]
MALGTTPPGAAPFGRELIARLEEAWSRQPAGYAARTRHLLEDGRPAFTNRLFLESSPYLRQHAHNPVNWYPWGDEAFEAAVRLGRPVLLSVGYSTCHWCHVMEEESFEDQEIARYLNEHYVAIKVDREERPDVDAIYMAAVQMLTGRGGWPMTVWLAADKKPFYGGTYFPPRDGDRGARTGFLTILQTLSAIFAKEPGEIREGSERITAALRAHLSPEPAGSLAPEATLDAALAFYRLRFDATSGGLRGAPKFPSSLPIRFLLRAHRRAGDAGALRMAELTLEKMAAGGLHDHVGGGFHRYSTDAEWLVPHFEKMLYDNALLVIAYLEAYQVTQRAGFADVARDILDYVQRDMTSPEGAFYSATDADSPAPDGRREEGWFFTWTPSELAEVLGPERAAHAAVYFGVTPAGNFEGRSILHVARSIAEVARELQISPDALRATVRQAAAELYRARQGRRPPLRDEKILTAWNGLMISAFARGALVLGDGPYLASARQAADFVLTRMRAGGRLLRSFKDGEARHAGYLDDYAFLIAGLLDLYEASGEKRWLDAAIDLDQILEHQHEDLKDGGFFMTSHDHEALLAREKPGYDGAEPSGNSVQALNLLRLHALTTQDRYRARAGRAIRAFAGVLEKTPAALSEMLLALDFELNAPKEIVIVVPRARAEAKGFLEKLAQTFVPNRVLLVAAEGAEIDSLASIAPIAEGKRAEGGQPTAYVCEGTVCALPTSDPDVFARQIADPRARDRDPDRNRGA